MKPLRTLMILACCLAVAAPAQLRVLKDMAGREVRAPRTIRKAYAMSPVAAILVYTLAPDRLAGWNYQFAPGEYKLLVEPYRSLPVLGGWFGKNNTGNIEEIVRAAPDVLLSFGAAGDKLSIATAERVHEQTGLPVYVGYSELTKLDAAYLALGDLLGVPERARDLADYCRKTVNEIAVKVKTIPEAQRRRVYYAEGPRGLETDPRGSPHAEAIDFAGGLNVAEVAAQTGYGQSPVSMEQIFKWNPEIVIAGYDHSAAIGDFYRAVWTDPLWSQTAAVKKHAVYQAPQYPFNWIDRPPSANRIIGLKWLARLFYPNLFPYDIRKETREFYAKFYHRTLSEAELNDVLAAAEGGR
jgi:iron complex transport system substrate-binding protein